MQGRRKIKLVLSCEHASNKVPAAYQALFAKDPDVLTTHRAYDPGTLALSQSLEPLANDVIRAEVSRLLIELNRSTHHPNLFSNFCQGLSNQQKTALLEKYYYPYRQTLETTLTHYIAAGYTVVHISVHSFTPILNGEVRNANIGFLYDPKRALEKSFCALWKKELGLRIPTWPVRFNYPYLGTADGLTTALRKRFSAEHYLGIELETNQALWLNTSDTVQTGSRTLLCQSLERVLQQFSTQFA